VARNPLTQKAASINPLQLTTDHERALWEEGERKAAARKAQHVATKAGASETPEQNQVDTTLPPVTVHGPSLNPSANPLTL